MDYTTGAQLTLKPCVRAAATALRRRSSLLRTTLRLCGVALLNVAVSVPIAAQGPAVDYESEIQPILTASCAGAFCHIGLQTSGVELSSYEAVMASVGAQYGGPIVVPGDPAASPLYDKIANENPRFGRRMPWGAPPLTSEEIARIERWILQGALPGPPALERGDTDGSGRRDITDAVLILRYLFQGGKAPVCEPVADVNADARLDLSDAVYLLGFLFQGLAAPPPLSPEEEAACRKTNNPPVALPIGTVTGYEGRRIEFSIEATDPDGDALTYSLEVGPEGLTIDPATGIAIWTPRFGEAGDYRIRVRVTDSGAPPLSVTTSGLVRVLEGNHPPQISALGTIYGREEVPLEFTLGASDPDGDRLTFELVTGPEGAELDPATGRFRWTPARGQAGEHVLAVRVRDDGEPPQEVHVQGLLVILPFDSPENQPPQVPPSPVYIAYPGYEIRRPVGATDPDGGTLAYEAENLPQGAVLDPATGVLVWTPAADQTGVYYVAVRVRDDGLPPAEAEALLIFRVLPLDPCVEPECDPAAGCTGRLKSLDEDCCTGEPEVRVPEAVAGCPEGRVLHLGRNRRGFGRLQNCDRLAVVPFPQGGANVRVNLEVRCVDTSAPARVRVRLETRDRVIFESERIAELQERTDGFAQRLAMIFAVSPLVPVFSLEGREAILSAVLTDAEGTVVEERVRVVLSLNELPDLPEPDLQDVAPTEAGCVGCHRPLTQTGTRHGIEEAHPWYPLTCVDCHGGDGTADRRDLAHVQPPEGVDFIKNMTSDELDRVRLDYLRFVNPGDLRVAAIGCGALNPANPGSGCHQNYVDTVSLSVMATYAGHYKLPRFLAGTQDRTARLAAVDVHDLDYDPQRAPPGAVPFLSALREPPPDADRTLIGTCMDVYLPKSCPTCHLNDFGPNNARGNYRSSGCTACHMLYADDGLSRSEDPVIDKDFPPHPERHRLTSAIPTEQCAHCHFQGGRIGLAYRGIREGGFPPEKTPEHGVTLGYELHAHDADYYFLDEDDRNEVDETPPDVHHQAGMVCADCHVGGDVHGDGHLYGSQRYQVGIRCEDCHGTVRSEVREDPEDGLFKNSKGFPLRRIRRTEDNRIVLRLAKSGEEIEIPQIHRILESGVNQAMIEAMGVNERGFSHTDTMECYACHNGWRLTCFGCHVTIDDSRSARNYTTGGLSQGAVSVSRDDYSIDFFALGVNERGKITPLCSSMSVFMSYIDETGTVRYRDRVRTSADGRLGFGWNPFHHHTVSRVPQNCDRCHPVAPGAGPDNTAVLRETYGFGSGKHLARDGDGVEYDLTRFLDDEGNLIAEFPHPDTGPVPAEVRKRALSIEVVPHPRR